MKLSSSVSVLANIATVAIAVCAILGIKQTSESLKETATINKMTAEYYATQNALSRPIFRFERHPSDDFSDFSKEGWNFPFAPEKICENIKVYNDGAWIKSVNVSIQTYLMTCYYYYQPTNGQFVGTAMFVPVKEFYKFGQNGKVTGLIATTESSKFQKKVMAQLRDHHNGNDGKHIAICTPYNVFTVEYEDAKGDKHREVYSMDMEITGKEDDLEHDLLYSSQLFKGRVFTVDDFDITTIMKEYGDASTELARKFSEKGYLKSIPQNMRPVIEEETK